MVLISVQTKKYKENEIIVTKVQVLDGFVFETL